MYSSKIWIFLCTISLIHGASKYYDGENRPYEFGYNIEGNQHRHESKDENGIIMGEFGFITGDGVYHVTAYATDENGNFKILFMKNIKIGLPGEPKTKTLPLPKKPPTRMAKKLKQRKPGRTRACSGCAIPKPELGINADNEDEPEKALNDINKIKDRPTGSKPGETPLFRPLSKKLENIPPNLKESLKKSQKNPETRRSKALQDKSQPKDTSVYSSPKSSGDKNQVPQDIRGAQVRNKQTANQSSQSDPPKAVDRNTLAEMRKMLAGLLYKFNYTLGYHGHHEKGDIIGSKDGGYFFTGRDGLRRDIEYVANQFGYQPYLTQEKANDTGTPREDTEKEAGLKGYEFKWYNADN